MHFPTFTEEGQKANPWKSRISPLKSITVALEGFKSFDNHRKGQLGMYKLRV